MKNNNLLEQLNQLFIEFSTCCEWSYLSTGEIAEKVAIGSFGSNIKVSTFVESGVPIIRGNDLRGYFLEEPSYNYITEAHADKLKNSIVYPKDIVFMQRSLNAYLNGMLTNEEVTEEMLKLAK